MSRDKIIDDLLRNLTEEEIEAYFQEEEAKKKKKKYTSYAQYRKDRALYLQKSETTQSGLICGHCGQPLPDMAAVRGGEKQ